jgi:hypothetical protein
VPKLTEALLIALNRARPWELRDAGPVEGLCPGDASCAVPLPPIPLPPVIDLAVIRLDRQGRVLDAANVQMDPDAPRGRVVALDRNLEAGMRFRRWSPERHQAGLDAAPFTDQDDLAPARGKRGRDFMAPYPASLFKLLVAFHVARGAAVGRLPLEAGVASGSEPDAEVRTVRQWLTAMITVSDNQATRALLRWLHERNEVERMNHDLAALGLLALRVDGTEPATGGRWAPGEIQMTAMDSARLLWLIAGGPGVLWRTPEGRPVTQAALPQGARILLLRLLAEQTRHEVLSAGSLCGTVPVGIPALVPEASVALGGAQELGAMAFGVDSRPCNRAAEVQFLHKTGLSWNFASDAGVVESLRGKPYRRYIIAILTSAGTRLVDRERANGPRSACSSQGICLTRSLAEIGAAVDAWAVAASAPRRGQR